MAEDKAEELDGEDEGSKSKKKLFIIIGAVVLLLIGAAVPFLMIGGDEDAEEAETTEEVAPEEDSGPKIAQYHAIPGAREPGMTITMAPGTKFRTAQMSFRVLTYSPELVEYLKKNDPMVRHYILNTLTTADTSKFMDKAGREQLQQDLKKMMVEMLANSANPADQALSDKVEDIYFNTFIMQ